MEEIWKVYLKNSRSVWEVSNLGRVRRNGEDYDLHVTPKVDTPRFAGGYTVYRAVAECFIPNPENKPCVDHIDADRLNNRADNLRWVTYSENNLNPHWIESQRISQLKHLENNPAPNTGREFSEEWCNNMSLARKGKHRVYVENQKRSFYFE